MPSADKTEGLILAIDLGKFKSVACAYEAVTVRWRSVTIENNRKELVRLLERTRRPPCPADRPPLPPRRTERIRPQQCAADAGLSGRCLFRIPTGEPKFPSK